MDSSKSASATGLQTVADIILAPKAALERLRTVPTWGWAFVISIVVYTIATYLVVPATVHALQTNWPAMVAADPRMQALSAAQQQQVMDFALSVARFSWIWIVVVTPLAMLVTTVVMLVFNAIGRGSGTFAALWAAAANIAVPTLALSGVVLAAIVLLRGADSFNSPMAIVTALPSLAWIVPSGSAKLTAFLGSISVFQLWGAVLIYLAMRVTARISVVPAVLAAIVMPLCTALWATAGAH